MDQLAEVAQLMLQIAQSNPKDTLDDSLFLGFIRRIKEFASSQGESTESLADIKRLLEGVQQDIAVVRTQTTQSISSATTGLSYDSATVWRNHNAQKWQADLRSAVTPVSQSAGSSTPGVTHAELGMDCEITVKIRDEALRAELRKVKPVEIVQRAERARAQAARSIPSLALAGHCFVAARQLPSGDISLRAHHAAAAEVLRQHSGKWASAFGPNAYVRVPTWGIVIDGVPVRSVDLQSESEDFKQCLIAENHHRWSLGFEVEIAYVGWLAKPRGYEGSLVVEFTNPIVANNAINGGTVWQSRSHTNRPYSKEGRCKMCKKCQKYGHVHAQCPNPKFYCGICAEAHPTWECPSQQDQEFTPKCANCKGAHKAASTSCPVRKVALERSKLAVANAGPHRVPHYLQAKAMQHDINPTPQEAAQIPKAKRGKAANPATKAPKAPPKAATKPAPKPRAPKRPKTTLQNQGESSQSAANAATIETAPEPVNEPIPEPTIDQSATQTIEQPSARIVNEPTTTITRPSTPEARETPTPTAPTIVRMEHKEVPTIPQANLEKRGRGRPPKSKSSNNDQQQQQAPTVSIESALAITKSGAPTNPLDLVAEQIHVPVYNEDYEPSPSPPLSMRRTTPIRKTPQPSRRTRKITRPIVYPQRATRLSEKRRREQSQESDGAPLPAQPTISATQEHDNIILSSTASFRELDSQALSSDVSELLNKFKASSQHAHARHRALPIAEDADDQSYRESSISPPTSPDELV
jgi:hypothetical protein